MGRCRNTTTTLASWGAEKMPDSVHLTLFVLRPMRNERWVRRLLGVFEEFPAFAPTHWSPKDQRSMPPYVEEEAVRGVVGDEFPMAQGVFKRAKEPKYEGFLFASNEELSTVKLKFDSIAKAQTYESLYAFGSKLAREVEPEFGVLHPVWKLGKKSQAYSGSGLNRSQDVQEYGLSSFSARTWLGKRLSDLLGDVVEEAGLSPTALTKRVLEIDLLESPWLADFEAMSMRREQVMDVLATTGLFGDYSVLLQYKKAEKWEPFGPVPRSTR